MLVKYMATPLSPNLLRLAEKIFEDSVEREAFIAALRMGKSEIPAVVWTGERQPVDFVSEERFSWQPEWVDKVKSGSRPGKSPHHEEGVFYSLDMSSVFALVPLLSAGNSLGTILDLCSSPGGKGILAWRHLHPIRILCNEVIGKRTAQLISNLRRCRVSQARVSNFDPTPLSQVSEAMFSAVIVDAPCSGQSLIAKGSESPSCFHPATINLNVKRQRRITAHAVRMLMPGGLMSYTTCTFSREENEGIVEWLLKNFPELTLQRCDPLESYRSRLTDYPVYRLYPHQSAGLGAFSALFRKTGEAIPADDVIDGIDAIPSIWDGSKGSEQQRVKSRWKEGLKRKGSNRSREKDALRKGGKGSRNRFN